MTQDWASFINDRTPFHCIYFDQKNAFDKIQCHLLLQKMSSMGIHEHTISVCSSYLKGRSFRVKVDNEFSEQFAAPTGVPQGSCLSPHLFNIFISDICKFIPDGVRYLVYADDLKLYCPIISGESVALLQGAIDGVSSWCKKNGMILSPSKCQVLKYGNIEANYVLNGEALPVSAVTRDLGINISPQLDFCVHIAQTVRSASVLINTLFRCFTVRTPSVYIHLYKSLILSKFIYCAPIWKPYLRKHRLALDSIHRKFVRRLRFRCGPDLSVDSFSIPLVSTVMDDQDVSVLFVLKRANLLDHFFKFNSNRLRSRCTVGPKSLARTERINNMFSWRVSRWIHEKGAPLNLL